MKTFHRQVVINVALVLVGFFGLTITSFSNAAPSPTETPSGLRPTLTPWSGPTITPSGPYFGRTRDFLKEYFKNLPAKAGSFSLILGDPSFDSPVQFAIKAADGTEYGRQVSVLLNSQAALFTLAIDKSYMDRPQVVNLGDEAVVDGQAAYFIAALRYRNMLVEIVKGSPILDPKYPTPIPPTNNQLIAALTDIYTQMLVPSVPTITPIPPTWTALPPITQTYVAQFRATPSGLRPTRTPWDGPTITPSGILLGIDPGYIRKIFDNAPKTIGGFPVTINPNQPFEPSGTVTFSFKNSDGTEYGIGLNFFSSAQSSYMLYSADAERLNGKTVAVGEQAMINGQHRDQKAIMRFRNMYVSIDTNDPSPDQELPTRVPLTDDQLTAILQDVYTNILLPNIPTLTPIPPTWTSAPGTLTALAPNTTTPTPPVVVTAQTAVATVQPN
ncbi:MAG: hypothetical protein ABI947_10135 [Chloroflexota bacterium]